MATQSLSVDQFADLIRNEVNRLCDENGWCYDTEADRGYAFQIWVARLFAQRDRGIETEPEESSFDRNDCKIDVVLEDPNQKILYFLQCKFVSVAQKPPIDDGEVNDFFGRHHVFFDKTWVHKHANEELLFYIGDYEDRLADGYQINYYFISTGRATDRVGHLADSFTSRTRETHPGVSFQVFDFYRLKELYIEAQTLQQSIPERVEIPLRRAMYIEQSKPRPTVLAIVKGNTLVNLYKKERERLFAYNIHSYMGKKGLNRDIIDTARTNPSHFYYFNNGVSAICTDYEIDEDNHTLRAQNFQIINGAQTVGALAAAPPNPEIEVSMRVTIGESVKTERGFNADMIKYNNSQNIIKSSDFRANDAIQLWLEQKLNALRPKGPLPKITYQRKRSSKRAKKGSYALRLEEAAKIRYTYLQEPTLAIGDPKALWTFAADGGVYETAFGRNGNLADFWAEEEFADLLRAVAFYMAIEEQIEILRKKDRKFTFMRRLRYFALRLAALYVDSETTGVDRQKLLENKAYFDDVFKRFWSEAARVLVDAHQQAVEAEGTTVFALARSDQRWRMVMQKFGMYLALPVAAA